MLPWPRRADVAATKPYTLNYPEFCCATGSEDFFDNNLVRCMFGAVCKKQISEQDFQSKLAELWGANPQIPIYQAEWDNGNVSYILAPGDWDIRIPYSWPDFPKYMKYSDYNNCKKYHGMRANNWTGVGEINSSTQYNEYYTESDYTDEQQAVVTSGLKRGLLIGGIFTVALFGGIVVLIRRSGRS